MYIWYTLKFVFLVLFNHQIYNLLFFIEFLNIQSSFFESLLTYKYNLDFSRSRIDFESSI